MTNWAGTEPEDIRAQLETAVGIIHFFAGPLYAQILLSMRKLEWPVIWGRVACRWSLFFSLGCRILPLVATGITVGWLDRVYFGYQGTTLPLVAETTQFLSQGFSLMILNLYLISTWEQTWLLRYGVQVAYLAVWGLIMACIIQTPANGLAPVPRSFMSLGAARTVFTGSITILVLRSIVRDRRLVSRPNVSRSKWKSVIFWLTTLYDEGFHYYFLAFIAQTPPLFIVAISKKPSGILCLVIRSVSSSATTIIGSLVLARMIERQTRCPVRHCCIILSFILPYIILGKPPEACPRSSRQASAELVIAPPRRTTWKGRSRQSKSETQVFSGVTLELRTLSADATSASLECGPSAEDFGRSPLRL